MSGGWYTGGVTVIDPTATVERLLSDLTCPREVEFEEFFGDPGRREVFAACASGLVRAAMVEASLDVGLLRGYVWADDPAPGPLSAAARLSGVGGMRRMARRLQALARCPGDVAVCRAAGLVGDVYEVVAGGLFGTPGETLRAVDAAAWGYVAYRLWLDGLLDRVLEVGAR